MQAYERVNKSKTVRHSVANNNRKKRHRAGACTNYIGWWPFVLNYLQRLREDEEEKGRGGSSTPTDHVRRNPKK